MSKKPTYEELEQRINELERKVVEHKRAEESLQLSEERYKGIFNNTKDGVAVYKVLNDGQDFIFSEFNEVAEKIDKIKKDALIGKSVAKVFPGVKDFGLFEVFQRVWKTGKPEHYPIAMYKDERIQGWRDNFVYKLPSEEIVAVYSDETQRKQAEEALRKSEEKYHGIFDESITAVFLFDDKKNFLDSNQAGLDLLGYSREELLNMSIPDVDADPIVVLPAHEKLLGGERIINYEHQLKRKDGKVITVLNNSRPIADAKGHVIGMQSTLVDITERKQAEEALKQAHDELENRVEERTNELQLKTKSLEELNTAMKVLLKKREEDKTEVEQNVMTNVRELIAPYFDKINKTKLDDHQKSFMSILESNLNEIVSPFTRRLSKKYLSLTPKEIQIINMIKIGYPSKKIAKIMKISPRTVDAHRKNIRGKIGLGKKRANLRSHLLAHEQ